MRIVLVNRYFHPDESATSRMVSSLAFGLAETGFPVEVVTSGQRHDERATALPRQECLGGVTIRRLPATRFGRAGLAGRAADYASFQAAAAIWSLAHLRRDDIVVACTDPPLLSVSLAIAARARGARLINWLHDIFPEVAVELGVLRRGGAAARLTLALRDGSLRRAVCNIVPTAAMAEGLCRHGLSRETLLTIPYWSEDAIEPVAPEDNRLRAAWGLRGAFVVGYSGNFGRSHEFDTLIEAATLLRDDDSIRFLLIGSGFGRARLEFEIERRGLGNVLLQPLQPRERLSESLSTPDLHLISLLPKLEPYVVPSKLYGIMAAGRPALFIGSAKGEVATALRRHGCGETVDIGAAQDLADRIVALRDDAPRRAQMGNSAREAFETRHRRSHALEAWARLLASSAQGEGPAP
jgi:colanic acid biosynthesis glycosyl transferase WcaI